MSHSSSSRPRTVLIGVSGYGRIHLHLAQDCARRGELDLVAAVVINEAEEGELVAQLREQGCAIYSDYEVMLAELAGTIDLCLVPTGIHWHARMTIAALSCGANVLVEKPLCVTMAEVEAIQAAEQVSGKFVAVGFQDLYEPGTLWLKSELVRGVIGTVKSVRFLGIWPRARRYFERNNWAGRLRVGEQVVYDSPLSNAFAHFVMLSLFFAGRSEFEAAEGELVEAELFRAHDIESFDTGVARLRTKAGVELWFGASHASRHVIEPQIEITGTEGTACWRYESEAFWRDLAGSEHRRDLLDVTGARERMMAATLRRLTDPNAPVCTPTLAGRHTSFIETLLESTPIETFAADRVVWSDAVERSDQVPGVEGLAEALQNAYLRGGRLATPNGSWAVSQVGS